jgi:hypothetical protein
MMTMKSMAFALAGATLLAGCVVISVDEHEEHRRARPMACNAADYQYLIGKAEDDIDRDRLPATFRIVCADCQVTMDYNPNRLNVQLDANNVVESVSCG